MRQRRGSASDDLSAQCPRHLSLRKLHHPVGRFPSAGSSGVSSPTSSVPISRLRLLAPPRASLRFLRSALPPLRPLRSPGAGRFPVGLDHFYRGARAASHRWRRRDLPGSWTTLAYMPRSSTPADHQPQALRTTRSAYMPRSSTPADLDPGLSPPGHFRTRRCGLPHRPRFEIPYVGSVRLHQAPISSVRSLPRAPLELRPTPPCLH